MKSKTLGSNNRKSTLMNKIKTQLQATFEKLSPDGWCCFEDPDSR